MLQRALRIPKKTMTLYLFKVVVSTQVIVAVTGTSETRRHILGRSPCIVAAHITVRVRVALQRDPPRRNDDTRVRMREG